MLARTSTIRLPNVLPDCTIAIVENMFSTSFWAVPAFNRVDPLITSGPTSTSMGNSTTALSGVRALQESPMVAAPSSRARAPAPSTNGVRPLEARAITASAGPTCCSSITADPASRSSSAPSVAETIAAGPPAIRPTTRPGANPKVGGTSDASRMPSLPGVPAPT